MAQNSVFSQIIKQIPRSKFEGWVRELGGDKRVRSLNCWTWFGSLLFSQLSGHDSIRSIERVFAHGDKQMKKLGFSSVRRSTLSDANHTRPVELLDKVLEYCLKRSQGLPRKSAFRFQGQVLALDSTFIRLCLSLSPWAVYRRSPKGSTHKESIMTAGVKMHTAIDLAGDIPEFTVIKAGSERENNDLKIAKELLEIKEGSTYVVDRAYWDFAWFQKIADKKAYFVTRFARRARFKVAKRRKVNRTQGLLCDQDIYFQTRYAKGKFKGKLRRISYRDPDTGKELVFITNRFDLEASTICALYKARWQVELFFKCLKQNLKIKKFLGFSPQAVRAQILTALIAYLLINHLKIALHSSISMPEAMAVIGTLLLLKMPLTSLLGKLPNTKRHPPPLQLRLVF